MKNNLMLHYHIRDLGWLQLHSPRGRLCETASSLYQACVLQLDAVSMENRLSFEINNLEKDAKSGFRIQVQVLSAFGNGGLSSVQNVA
ncbi:hypothetical protein ACFXTH_015088 [Malus domestica]